MTKKEIRQKYCDKRNYTSWNKYNITEYSKWLENELIKSKKKVKKLTIPVVSYGYWFMEKLNYMQREKIRVHYGLKEPTLKITNEMLKEIYEIEMSKPEWERLLESVFYNYG